MSASMCELVLSDLMQAGSVLSHLGIEPRLLQPMWLRQIATMDMGDPAFSQHTAREAEHGLDFRVTRTP